MTGDAANAATQGREWRFACAVLPDQLRQSGHKAVANGKGRFGCIVSRGKAGSARREDQGCLLGHLPQARGDDLRVVWNDKARHDLRFGTKEQVDESGAGAVLLRSSMAPVARGDHDGGSAGQRGRGRHAASIADRDIASTGSSYSQLQSMRCLVFFGAQPSFRLIRQRLSPMPAPLSTQTDESELRPASTHAETDPALTSMPGSENGSVEPVDSPAAETSEAANDPDAPLSFVPHTPLNQTARPQPLRIRTGRYGELDEHELVTLLDSIEDERARARFRESVYISLFVWIAVVLFVFFGPKYLWHSPRLVLPSEVLQARELTTLNAPSLQAPRPRAAPPAVDSHTLEHLRSREPKIAPAPRPSVPEPTPRVEPRPLPPPSSPKFQPSTAPPNLPSAPTPQVTPTPRTTPPPVVADAPRPQPTTRPDFNTGSQSAGDAIQNAVRNATPGGGSPGGIRSRPTRGGSQVGMGPAEILSDTQGVNFNPYLQRILREIYDQWIPLIPEEARPPLMKSGVTAIRFTILPDGTIGAMHLDDSTHDDALNRAAWGSVTGVGQFPSLPSQFHGPNLELRIHYLVNQHTE